MVSTVLLVVHIIFVAIMIGLILLQKSEGGGLGMGGGGGLMTARGTANLLTHSTAIMATLFFVSTVVLAISFKGAKSGESILEDSAAKTEIAKKAPVVDPAKPTLPKAAPTPAVKK